MARIILMQWAVAIIIALLATLLVGEIAGVSSILAGLSCVIPNTLFAFGLQLFERKAPNAGLAPLYVWELVKVVLTIALMVAVFWWYRELNWVAFLVSFALVLKSYLILLLLKPQN